MLFSFIHIKPFAFFAIVFLAFSLSCKKGTDVNMGNTSNGNIKPKAGFTLTTSDPAVLPVKVSFTNTTVGSDVAYSWSFGNGTSSDANPTLDLTEGGIYPIKLVARNSGGSDSITKEVRVSPYPQSYFSFGRDALNLNAWEGSKVMILSRNKNLNRATMFKWLKVMDTTYGYYRNCTGKEPFFLTSTYINNRTTIADVTNTCGAGCAYLGNTGIELQNTYFDIMYNAINNNNQYDQVVFYEFGRNFWFYESKLNYKLNDPVATGYAVFMRFMAMEAAGVNGAPFNSWSFPTFRTNVENLINTYLANPSLEWANTLGIGQGVPGSGLGATDLFASFCFRLRRDYGGETFVRNLWKQAGLRPNATVTQDAVDNFFLASCAAANRNLTTVFQSWRWRISPNAVAAALQYP
jgi:PKD repeat protein